MCSSRKSGFTFLIQLAVSCRCFSVSHGKPIIKKPKSLIFAEWIIFAVFSICGKVILFLIRCRVSSEPDSKPMASSQHPFRFIFSKRFLLRVSTLELATHFIFLPKFSFASKSHNFSVNSGFMVKVSARKKKLRICGIFWVVAVS